MNDTWKNLKGMTSSRDVGRYFSPTTENSLIS
jgi:hypothetical protein